MAGTAGAMALVAGLLPAVAAQASPAGDSLVISEAYLNGGSSGATYLNKYVEIHNPTDADIDVSGWSVQYRSYSATGNFTGIIALGEHHVEPGGSLLVGGNSNASNGEALPTPDVASNIAFSGNANGGTLALVKRSTAMTGERAAVLQDDDLVDLVGYGASATYEGSG
ncbi:MAG: lamin tail domain-containing protein, partial [Aeromicrobium sp.]